MDNNESNHHRDHVTKYHSLLIAVVCIYVYMYEGARWTPLLSYYFFFYYYKRRSNLNNV